MKTIYARPFGSWGPEGTYAKCTATIVRDVVTLKTKQHEYREARRRSRLSWVYDVACQVALDNWDSLSASILQTAAE